MKRFAFMLFLLAIPVCLPGRAAAVCAEGSNWKATWNDSLSQTTYTLEAPCKAYIGIPFNVTATVTDATYPNSDVGGIWKIADNGATIAGGTGFNWITLAAGQWQRVITQTYSGAPIDHTIEFTFTDFGEGPGGHSFAGSTIGAITVDPLPPDADGDGIFDFDDNCPLTANNNQADVDADGTGDACDEGDTDGDGLTDRQEWVFGTDPGVADQDLDAQDDGTDSNPFDSGVTGAIPTPLNVDVEFVRQVYRDFLNREADQGGLNYWVGELAVGRMTRAAMVEQYLLSAEFGEKFTPVARLYFACFNRIPDYSGLMYWVNEYTAGNQTLFNIAGFFAVSPEFQATYGSLDNGQFIDLIYANLFNRVPDAEGRAYWVGELDAGNRTQGEVMVLFSDSVEYRASMANQIYVTMTYIGLLRHAPEQSGFDYWVGEMAGGRSGQELIGLFLGSAEYAGRFDGSGWTVPTMVYAYPYHREAVVVDEDENGDGTVDTRYATNYSYDTNNVLTQTTETYDTDANGSIESTVTTGYAYDGNGNLRTVTRGNDWDNDGLVDSIWTTSYTTDPLGRVIQRVEAKDYDADGNPEVTLPTLNTWNGEQLLNSQVTAIDGNDDGLVDAVEAVRYGYDGNGRLATVRTERDEQNDGSPESIRESTYSWSGDSVTIVSGIVDSNGDTTIDWVETQTYGYDANGNLTLITTTIDLGGDGSVEDVTTLAAGYDQSCLLLDFTLIHDWGNDGTADYQKQVTPTFTASGMPTSPLPESPDRPVVLPVAVGVLQ